MTKKQKKIIAFVILLPLIILLSPILLIFGIFLCIEWALDQF
jgi:hypothetical protein